MATSDGVQFDQETQFIEKRELQNQIAYLNKQNVIFQKALMHQKQLLKKKNEELKQKEEEIEILHIESRTRELLTKSTEEMRELCIKNENTLCHDIDDLQERIKIIENDRNKLKQSLESKLIASSEDRGRLNLQLDQKEATIKILKKQKEVMEERLITVKKTVELLEQKSAPSVDVTSEASFVLSQPLKQLIEKDVRLEQEYKKTEKELQNHERLYDVQNDMNIGENNRNHEDGDGSGAEQSMGCRTLPSDVTPTDFPDDNTQRAIAGDLDRQKIAELYKNLYDNHWHVALKVANHVKQKAKRRTKVKGVLKTFEKAFAFCKDAFDQQKLDVIDKLKEESSAATHADEARVMQQMRNGTTPFVLSLIDQVFQKTICLERYDQSLADEYPIFLKESIRICWLMNLHDPPVVLKENVKSGDEFNPAFYVKQHDGDNTVDFVVLPTLMLNSGLIIAKGVVQCKQIKRKQSKGILMKKSVN